MNCAEVLHKKLGTPSQKLEVIKGSISNSLYLSVAYPISAIVLVTFLQVQLGANHTYDPMTGKCQ